MTAPLDSELDNVMDHTEIHLLGKYFMLNFKLFVFLSYKSLGLLETVSILLTQATHTHTHTHTHTKPCVNGLFYGNGGK